MVKELLSILGKPNLTVSEISKGFILEVIFLWFTFFPSQIVTELGTYLIHKQF